MACSVSEISLQYFEPLPCICLLSSIADECDAHHFQESRTFLGRVSVDGCGSKGISIDADAVSLIT